MGVSGLVIEGRARWEDEVMGMWLMESGDREGVNDHF